MSGTNAMQQPRNEQTPSSRLRVAVFASGSGSNFQAIVDACTTGQLNVEIGLLVCDKPQAYVLERAARAGVPVYAFRAKDFANRDLADAAIVEQLRANRIDWVVLAGYMRLLSGDFVQAYANRIINIHPSLLPAFPGLDAIGQAVRYGVKVSGVTVHLVDEGLDSGPVIAQAAVEFTDEDTIDTFAMKIHAAEHRLYPQVLQWIEQGRLIVDGRVCRIAPESATGDNS